MAWVARSSNLASIKDVLLRMEAREVIYQRASKKKKEKKKKKKKKRKKVKPTTLSSSRVSLSLLLFLLSLFTSKITRSW